MIGGWKKLRNEELHNMSFSPNIRMFESRRMRRAGHGERRNKYKILARKPKGKPLRILMHSWKRDIKMDPKEIRVGRCELNLSGSV